MSLPFTTGSSVIANVCALDPRLAGQLAARKLFERTVASGWHAVIMTITTRKAVLKSDIPTAEETSQG